ncbi:LamG-like jellyroll fold domain-containing protein [Lacinutrix undariae]
MNSIPHSIRKYALLISLLLICQTSFSQDFNIQHVQSSVPRNGKTETITSVSSLNSAFVLNNNNRKSQAGRTDQNDINQSIRDMSGAVTLTAPNTLNFHRQGNSTNNNTQFSASVWEYTGVSGGDNEFIVRGRYQVALDGTNSSVTQTLSGVTNANNCIPFITGIISDDSSAGADSGTAIAYLENATTLRLQKGANASNVTVYVTLVEFTGANWTIAHGNSTGVSADTGNITLKENANGTGDTVSVSAWENTIIFSQHRGNMNDNDINQALSDNWPIMKPGSDNSTVAWEFDSAHDANGNTDRHIVHVANNPNITVTRISNNTSNTAGETPIDITSAALISTSEALIVGTSITSGTGVAYGRGWRNFYFNSTTEAAHWSHRSGNNMKHEIQIINLRTQENNSEIKLSGANIEIINGDTTPIENDDTHFGVTTIGNTQNHTFTITNTGTATLNLTGGTPIVDISGNSAFTIITQPTGNTVAPGDTKTFIVRFTPLSTMEVSAIISIDNNDSNENPYTFTIAGTGTNITTNPAPGGVTSDLALWLKGNDGHTYTSGDQVSLWLDKGNGADATVNTPGQEPTYYDNATRNVNFNPVVEFDNTYATYSLDTDYSFDNTNTQFLEGTSGLYTQDIFLVLIPDDTELNKDFGFMDAFCGDADFTTNTTDATGIGMGKYTGRVDNETICFAIDTYDRTSGDGYAVYDGPNTTYDNVGIINARTNTSNTQQELYYNANDIETGQNDLAEFLHVENSRYWIGRSEGWEATLNARVCEIITYTSRKNDVNLTQQRNRIQSYLGIKYGITLGINGTSQDYVDSDGTLIWDVNTGISTNDVFNYDIAGIGRDDASKLLQKQSRSVNKEFDGAFRAQGVLTIGLSTIYDTNNLNPDTFINDKEFLVWGNDGVDLDDPAVVVEVDMSTAITPAIPGGTHVQFNGIARTWKVTEKGGDIPTVEVAILKSAVRTATPPNGEYLMFISDTPNFGPTADYRIMEEDTNELGEAILNTKYDFDGTKYITFGWAPERVYVRSIYFNGSSDYVDMENALNLNTSEFTISSWINRESGSENTSILSKRNQPFTEGYDFNITATGHLNATWYDATSLLQTITSSVVIPEDQWHQVAIIYKSGIATLYIDGIADTTSTLNAPATTSQSFYIGAANKNTPTNFFKGNIDEVRVWDKAISEDQLHFIMNQELANNSNFIGGSYFINRNITPTKNDVSTLPWNALAGYYPMTTYTYTNTKDESGNGNQGALRYLRTVDKQTAPLPYTSNSNGNWNTSSTWTNGDMQTIPGTTSIVDNTKTIDWNIVETSHNITMENSTLPTVNNDNRSVLGLFVDDNTLTVPGDHETYTGNGITISHYLALGVGEPNAKIDLEGESQLIQTKDSDFDVNSEGRLDRDQQGTQDTYTYNYWSSPVGKLNSVTNNNKYNVTDVITDDNLAINFSNSGYDGANTTPVKIANYWIWKFANQTTDDYSSWQHIRSSGDINAGEGFTMKGPNPTANSILDNQNYTFTGKPNNGDINLTINANNDYLVGNPYPSAIDANQFILDNGPIINGTGATNGTLYFWEHWGGGNHILAEYQGGYGIYNLSGGTASASQGTTDPDVGSGGVPSKRPGRYIPVSQGFFVTAEGNGGTINFNNGQRVFEKETSNLNGGASVFIRIANTSSTTNTNEVTINSGDNRMKIRLGFNSSNSIRRQLLLTIDDNATEDIDWGYDGKLNEDQMDDMFWMIENQKYIIQGSNIANDDTTFPIGFNMLSEGMNILTIDELENVPENTTVYVHNLETNIYHNLSENDFEFYLPEGEYLSTYEITFRDQTNNALSIEDNSLNALQVFYANTSEHLVLINPNTENIKSMLLYNMIGQHIQTFNTVEIANHSEYTIKNLSTGTYIIKLETDKGSLSKKILVK